ncbi:MAG: hypothetical protein WD049_00930 [Candidatus Paceibacterota bacterium]
MRHKPRTAVRTQETFNAYERFKQEAPDGCPLCRSESIEEYEHWRMIPNDFPYDTIADEHCMLLPKEHIGVFEEMADNVRQEYNAILASLDRFDAVLRNFPKQQTIPEHFHAHLLAYKVIE